MISGVYSITNNRNGKMYVGSAKRILNRWSVHVATLRAGNHHSAKLQNSWDKHGEDAFEFEILILCDPSHMTKIEQFCMDKFDSVRSGYNVLPFAGSNLGYKLSMKTKRTISRNAIRIAADPAERLRRSLRAKAQHRAGKFGQATWTKKPKYNPKSARAGTKALNSHIASQSSAEMSRRSYCRRIFQ